MFTVTNGARLPLLISRKDSESWKQCGIVPTHHDSALEKFGNFYLLFCKGRWKKKKNLKLWQAIKLESNQFYKLHLLSPLFKLLSLSLFFLKSRQNISLVTYGKSKALVLIKFYGFFLKLNKN